MEISDLDIVMFNIYDYFKKPFIRVIYESNLKELKGARFHIYTKEDLIREVAPHSKHVRWLIENELTSFNPTSYFGDAARLYLATKFKNCLYIDADFFITKRYVERLINSDKDLVLPGAFNNTFTTSIFFCKNYGHPFLKEVFDAYENITDPKDYGLCDWQFIEKKFSPEKRREITKLWQFIPYEYWDDAVHIGYGKFMHFYSHIFAKNPTFAYTTKDIDLDNPLVKKYRCVWIINNNEPYRYRQTSETGEEIFYLKTGSVSIDKMILYFLLDIDYHARILGVKPKVINIDNEC